ncbi:hypothetical protein NXT3_CH01231 [Sinorhizobium fredii]|uniref:Uncharacterized protein n=1 Tax=Rhizobium fredii TaxID=380 RepID=A0A2L0H2W8_RHIFR|nr:hypothetical protein NXT3_CH01231 [Sinorhizobium fredii]
MAARGSPRRARRHSQSRAEKRMMRRICQGRGAPAARPIGTVHRNVAATMRPSAGTTPEKVTNRDCPRLSRIAKQKKDPPAHESPP